MEQDELDLLHAYLDGTISDTDFARLQALLRENVEARRTLRGLATVDAKLQELGALSTRTGELLVMPTPPPARSRYALLAWGCVAAAAACVALMLSRTPYPHVNSSRSQSDVAAAVRSTQEAIARLSVEPSASLPAWTSPTASLLDQPRISE